MDMKHKYYYNHALVFPWKPYCVQIDNLALPARSVTGVGLALIYDEMQ